jgi:hypothetical protein
MASVVDDLEHAARYLEDARLAAKNAVVLLDRISGSLTDDAIWAKQLLEETRDRTRRAAESLGTAR